jgi:hypothetical protein
MNGLRRLFNKTTRYLMLLISTAVVLPYAQADDSVAPEDNGGSVFHASVQVGGSYTDNFYFTPNPDQNVFGLVLAPELLFAHNFSRFRFTAQGAAESAIFNAPGKEDDYIDGKTKVGLEWQSAERHRFNYGANVNFSHDPFGTERTTGSPAQNTTLDRWRQFGSGIKYFYGLPADGFNVESELVAARKQYTSNQDVTQALDYSTVLGDVTFLYNYSPKSALLFDVTGVQTNFEKASSSKLDSNALHYLVGGRWVLTSKTDADVRVGYVTRRPRDSSLDSFNTVDWRVNLHWGPTAYRSFTLKTARTSDESYAANTFSFIDNRSAAVSWSEDWAARFTTKTEINYIQSRFVGFSRVDDYYSAKLEGEYRVAQYTALLANVGYAKRTSNITNLDFNRLNSYVGIKFSR